MSGGGSKQLHLTVKEHPVELKYDLLSTVGAGSYGKAVLATRKADGEKVVVKQIFLRDLDDKAREEALHEVGRVWRCKLRAMLDWGCARLQCHHGDPCPFL